MDMAKLTYRVDDELRLKLKYASKPKNSLTLAMMLRHVQGAVRKIDWLRLAVLAAALVFCAAFWLGAWKGATVIWAVCK